MFYDVSENWQPQSGGFYCFTILKDKTNPWVYYYSTAYRTPGDVEIYEQFVEQDQASTVVKSRDQDCDPDGTRSHW